VTAPTTEQLPVRVPGRTLPPDLIHVTCCRDDDPGDVALCGTEVAGEWMDRGTSPSCIVCADLADADCDDELPACPLMALVKGRRR